MKITQIKIVNGLKTLSWSAVFTSLFWLSQSYALSLQNIEVNSHLGEPLDAIVRVQAAPGEALRASCLSTSSPTDAAMPAIRGISLSLSRNISSSAIRLTTSRPVMEPMSEIVLQVKCPGVPHISRNFLVMVDPIGNQSSVHSDAINRVPTSNAKVSPTQPTFVTDDPRIQVTASTQTRGVTRNNQHQSSIARGSRYLVNNGDALSTIASRIEGRQRGSLWNWAATIQSANPHAFINANPNELISGSYLHIPAQIGATASALSFANDIPPIYTQLDNLVDRGLIDKGMDASVRPTFVVDQTNRNQDTQPVQVTSHTASQAVALGNVFSTQPMVIQSTMVLSPAFSKISRERLAQREKGLVYSVARGLPNFAQTNINDNKEPSAPQEKETPNPVVPTEQDSVGVINSTHNSRRFPWWGWLGLLGLLGLSFLGGLGVAAVRARKDVEREVNAKLAEARYLERIRSSRRNRTAEVLSGGASAGIVVTEGEEDEQSTVAQATAAEIDANHVIADDNIEPSDANRAGSFVSNDLQSLASEPVDLDVGVSHTLTNVDLELLEQDYAERSSGQNLEQIADAGRGTQITELIESKLDMEFPEDVKMRRENNSFERVEFDGDSNSLDFNIDEPVDRQSETLENESLVSENKKSENVDDQGSENDSALNNDLENLGIDVEEAGANIDAQLKAIDDIGQQEEPQDEILLDHNILVGNEDNERSATSNQESEEFYHLETSSIMHVGELDFERDVDDETNILKFRKRNTKTGTDDIGEDTGSEKE